MEKLVLFIPDLESHFYRKKEFQESITQLADKFSHASSHTVYVPEERKLYLRSVSFGMMRCQLVLLDFRYNKITFVREKNSLGDANHGVHELLSSLRFNFQPEKMSFIMERPEKKNYSK